MSVQECITLGTGAPIYVPQSMLLNDGPVTITTMKLNVQFEAVDKLAPLERMLRGRISGG